MSLKSEQPSEVGYHSTDFSLPVQDLSKPIDDRQSTRNHCTGQRRNEQRHFLIVEMSRVDLIKTTKRLLENNTNDKWSFAFPVSVKGVASGRYCMTAPVFFLVVMLCSVQDGLDISSIVDEAMAA